MIPTTTPDELAGITAADRPLKRKGHIKRSTASQILTWVVLAMMGVVTLVPFAVTFILAMSPVGEPTLPEALPRRLTLDNLQRALGSSAIVQWTINSMVYAVVSTAFVLLMACMAGYALAKKPFPGSKVLLWGFLGTIMIPGQVTLIPLFTLVSAMDGINTMWGMILPTLANSQAVFLMRQFILGLPDEIFDAARIDGASEWRVFVQIVMPLTKPIMATLAIFVFLWHWNDFLWPLVVAQKSSVKTLTVGLAGLETEGASVQSLMSSAAITVIPCLVIFFLLQRYLVRGVAAGAVKG